MRIGNLPEALRARGWKRPEIRRLRVRRPQIGRPQIGRPQIRRPQIGREHLAWALTALSAAGGPASAVAHLGGGRAGHAVGAVGSGALFGRDLSMVATGTPARLRPLPRLLLATELVTSAVATMAGLYAAVVPHECARAAAATGRPWYARTRRVDQIAAVAAVGTFALHTARMWRYTKQVGGTD